MDKTTIGINEQKNDSVNQSGQKNAGVGGRKFGGHGIGEYKT